MSNISDFFNIPAKEFTKLGDASAGISAYPTGNSEESINSGGVAAGYPEDIGRINTIKDDATTCSQYFLGASGKTYKRTWAYNPWDSIFSSGNMIDNGNIYILSDWNGNHGHANYYFVTADGTSLNVPTGTSFGQAFSIPNYGFDIFKASTAFTLTVSFDGLDTTTSAFPGGGDMALGFNSKSDDWSAPLYNLYGDTLYLNGTDTGIVVTSDFVGDNPGASKVWFKYDKATSGAPIICSHSVDGTNWVIDGTESAWIGTENTMVPYFYLAADTTLPIAIESTLTGDILNHHEVWEKWGEAGASSDFVYVNHPGDADVQYFYAMDLQKIDKGNGIGFRADLGELAAGTRSVNFFLNEEYGNYSSDIASSSSVSSRTSHRYEHWDLENSNAKTTVNTTSLISLSAASTAASAINGFSGIIEGVIYFEEADEYPTSHHRGTVILEYRMYQDTADVGFGMVVEGKKYFETNLKHLDRFMIYNSSGSWHRFGAPVENFKVWAR